MKTETQTRKEQLAAHRRELEKSIDAELWEAAHFHAREIERITQILILLAKQALQEASW